MVDTTLDKPRWIENLPFWGVHVTALAMAIWVGWSWQAAAWLGGTYLLHMFTVTAIYHRYFSHRTFKMNRFWQFVFALIGTTAAQKGPIWWASHHRRHHKYSDQVEDIHSPRQRGFWWSHMFWILAKRYRDADTSNCKDFTKYPELVFLDKHEQAITVAFAALLFVIGGPVALAWGFFVSIVATWHCTFFINSLAHVWGNTRYQTGDDSRNNFWLAILTLGEGWHNNHHYYQRSTRQGFFWWEIDISYYMLRGLQLIHVVSEVQGVPRHVRDAFVAPQRARVARPSATGGAGAATGAALDAAADAADAATGSTGAAPVALVVAAAPADKLAVAAPNAHAA